MSRRGSDVVVVGAGVVGAALSLALARGGRRVALVEAREPTPWSMTATPDLRVFAISPASAALFDALGVWTAMRGARAQPYRHMRVWDAAGGADLRFDASEQGQPALGWIVEQSLLQHVLWQALLAEPGIVRHCPDRVHGLEQHEDGVEVSLESGLRLRAALAVAADGADSRLRELAGVEVDRHDYRQRGVVAFVTTESGHGDTAWQRFLPGGPLAFLPFADGRCSIVWTLPDAEAERVLQLPDDAFLRELERAFDARLGALTATSRRAAFPLRRQLAREFLRGRVLLAGDAAHVVHPLAGQGVNLGLQDVASLRDALAATGDGRAVAGGHGMRGTARDASTSDIPLAALRRHARARRSDSTVAAFAFDAINRGFSNDRLLPTLLRGHALGLVDRAAPLKQLLARHAAGWL